MSKLLMNDIGALCRCLAYCEDCPLYNGKNCMVSAVGITPRDWDLDYMEKNLKDFFGIDEE